MERLLVSVVSYEAVVTQLLGHSHTDYKVVSLNPGTSKAAIVRSLIKAQI